ncbi:FAD/NAD(P)-binding domain-containing protein [Parathielavia appendiculata]|uniref:FAD/NAD(P)-binding domain-containing protein n=1 Tax=Parathielavia appendiculata TaxID=2587402 RepID=A0AAN6U3C2_9PEZI|nr:FAD/NAD(P)-binding domain-containing protein [Parathielavia appendiculata]
MTETILILGGSLAGLHVAHAILKKRSKNVKVIMVSKNSHFYMNLASVRAIVPGQIKDDELFTPIETALSRYPRESWDLIIGTAAHADFENKTVEIVVHDDSTTRTISYDQLVLATGSRSADPSMPWKASGSYKDAVASVHKTAEQVQAAQHIVVAGAGGTGIEVAGELGYEYGKTKNIVLLCSGDKLANGHGIATDAANELKKLNVAIKYGARVQKTQPTAQGKTDVVLSDGETITTDLYLPTIGLIPNTEYIPTPYCNSDPNSRTVLVDDYLRVRGAEDVWACGDIVGKPRAGFLITQAQAKTVAKNIEAALGGAKPSVHKGMPVDVFVCSVGRSRGVGRMNNSIKFPSLMVWAIKGRTLGLNYVEKYIGGSIA